MKVFNVVVAIITGIIFYLLDESPAPIIRFIWGIAAAQGGYIGANIGDLIRRKASPDVIFYRNAGDYMSNRIYWLFGVNIVGGIAGAVAGFMGWAFFVSLLKPIAGTIAFIVIGGILDYYSTKLLIIK